MSGGVDNVVKVWDLETSEQVLNFTVENLKSVSYTNLPGIITVRTTDGKVLIYKLGLNSNE